MSVLKISNKCEQCHGTGTYYPHGQSGMGDGIPCPWPGCNGTGTIDGGDVDLAEDHYFSHDVLECATLTELNALSADMKLLLNTVLGSTILNLAAGTKARSWLLDTIFPDGTDTHDNIEALIGT